MGNNADLMARHKQVSEKGGNRGSRTPRAMGNKSEDSGVKSIATRRSVRGQSRNMASDTPRAMETEMVASNGDLIARTVGGRERHERGNRQGAHDGRQGTRRGMQGTWSHPTRKRAKKGEQNKEISNLGPNLKRGSPSAERLRSCKKTFFSWLIDCKIIKEDEQVWYKDGTRKRAMITGRITRDGILCSCCQEETSVWTFEKHSGSDLRQPYEHIYTRNLKKGKCQRLKKCLKSAWKCKSHKKPPHMFRYVPKETSADQNDDACSVCGDGGELICCDKCPSTYHLTCMNIERVPENYWFCPYCVCKYCGLVVDLVEEKNECFEKKESFKCSQCAKKCHRECIEKEFPKENLDLNPSRSYCGPGCREIHDKLEVSLGIRNYYSAKYSWRVIRRLDKKSKKVYATRTPYYNSSVAVTWMLMNEAFETITDRNTGINVIQSIVYSCGSDLARIDFSRFHMFVLEKDEDEIIAAASIRFHGEGIAEMPFIATEAGYRSQGVCQDLMRVIESFLCNLEVKNLIIPSTLETSEMWKRKFNFTEVSEELEREISSYNILMFPCALRLCKDLSASIADRGNDIEDDQTDLKNDLGPQMEQTEATAILEDGPSSGRLEVDEVGIVTDGK